MASANGSGLQSVPPIDNQIQNNAPTANNNKKVEEIFPGLEEIVDRYIESEEYINQDDFARELLLVFKKSKDDTYKETLAKYDKDEQKALDGFVCGMPLEKATKDLDLEKPTLGAREQAEQIMKGEEINLRLPVEHTPAGQTQTTTEEEFNYITQDEESWFLSIGVSVSVV